MKFLNKPIFPKMEEPIVNHLLDEEIVHHLIPSDDEMEASKILVQLRSPKKIFFDRLCKFKGCVTYSSFNFKGKRGACFCSKHKLPGMINIFVKRCHFQGCHVSASFNFPSEKRPLFCSRHKEPKMISFR